MRILHLVSTFPAITHTFVFRTMRFFRQQGDEVIIVPSVPDEEARNRFPEGWKAPRPYIRFVGQPKG